MSEVAPNESILISFKGELNTVEANTLVGAVVGYSAALHQISEALNSEAEIQVRVAAPQRGSFEFLIEVAEFTATSLATIAMFGPAGVSLASQVVENWAGLLKLMKHLKGAKPEKTEVTKSGLVVENQGGGTMIFERNIFLLYQEKPGAVEALASAFRAIEEEPAIERVEISDVDETDEAPRLLFEAEREEFSEIAKSGDVARPDRRTEVVRAEIYPVKWVTEPGLQWSGYYKGNKIKFQIAHKPFFDEIKRMRFGHGDIMIVDLEITQQLDPDIGIYVNKSYRVLHVHEYREQPKPTQGDLPLGE